MTDQSEVEVNLNPFDATVIGFVDPNGELMDGPAEKQFKLLIDLGSTNNVKVDERVLVFALGPEIKSPNTGESLGHFEIVRGEGRVRSVQATMAVVECTETVKQLKAKPQSALMAIASGGETSYQEIEVDAPFRKPALGDLIRFI